MGLAYGCWCKIVPAVIVIPHDPARSFAGVRSRAEPFDAAKSQLRVEVGGGGKGAELVFPAGGGPAHAVRFGAEEFVRKG